MKGDIFPTNIFFSLLAEYFPRYSGLWGSTSKKRFVSFGVCVRLFNK